MRTCPTCQRTFSDDTDFCPRDGTALLAVVTAIAAQLTAGLSRRFRIVRELGAGGMGAVFLAEQIQVGNRPIALKVLLRKLLDDPEFLLRFQDEAASTGRIHHPNVVTIYESGQTDDGTPYIAMEYLEGETLRQMIQRRGALAVKECAEIIQQVARGLGAAHRLGIIHRDLKPDNVFLTRSEEGDLIVKVVDFGIAKLRESATHTVTGMVLGTPQYMSFEQASGMRSEKLDARSDLYSLGVIAYEMLTGRLPFNSDTPLGYLRGHLTETPAPIRIVNPDVDVSVQIENVVMKALAKDRDQRYGSVTEFAQEFAKAGLVIAEAPRGALPPTIRVLSQPAPDPAPTHSGILQGDSAEFATQRLSPSSERIEPANDSQHAGQHASPVGDFQHASPTPQEFGTVATHRGTTRYWALGLVAAAVITAGGAWHFYRTGMVRPIQSAASSEGIAPSASLDLAPGNPVDKEAAKGPTVQRGRAPLAPAQTTVTVSSAAHVDAANRLAGKGDWDGAITEYHEALRIDPNNANAHYNLGGVLEQQGNLEEALQEYREAYTINPQNPVFQSAYERLTRRAKLQTETAPDLVTPAPAEVTPAPRQAPTPVVQVLVRGGFIVQNLNCSTVSFTVPESATQVKIKGMFRASGGTGNDIEVVIASPAEFQNWINGRQARVFYVTRQVTTGTIDVENIPPGVYILGFNNKFALLSRKQVTAVIALSYVPE